MAITNRRLKLGFTGGLSVNYFRTDIPITQQGVKSTFNYTELEKIFTHGSGGGKCNQFHFSTRQLINNVEIINLNGGLSNQWGDELNFNSIKLIIIRNKETAAGRFLQVRFKNEVYYIGPRGYRVICEHEGGGLEGILSSNSSEEGSIVFSTDSDVSFDFLIGGSSDESSSSSGA